MANPVVANTVRPGGPLLKPGAMLRVFALSGCDTCRAALQALRAAGHEPQVTDLRALPPQDLAAIIAAFGPAALNRASTTWRELADSEKARPMADLLADYPTLIKRPVIAHGDAWHQGWTPQVRAALEL